MNEWRNTANRVATYFDRKQQAERRYQAALKRCESRDVIGCEEIWEIVEETGRAPIDFINDLEERTIKREGKKHE
jgi:hypothetical protein